MRRIRLPLACAAFALAVCAPTLAARAAPVPVDIQERHANGASVQITSIDVTDTEVRPGVRIVNAHTRLIDLNAGINSRKTFVEAGPEARLLLVAPNTNPQLNVPPQSTMEGTLVFMGALSPDAPLAVIFNASGSEGATTGTPLIRIDLPADAVAASRGEGAEKTDG